MGVSGSGKTTIGRALADRLGLPYIEGDDYHPPANVAKMTAGEALTSLDRQPWLERLAEVLAKAEDEGGGVLASSALRAAYRDTLRSKLDAELRVVYLAGEYDLLLARLNGREGHFFPPHLLRSQFEALELPRRAITVNVDQPVSAIVDEAIERLEGSRPSE